MAKLTVRERGSVPARRRAWVVSFYWAFRTESVPRTP